jgi:hypothetical protein
LTTYHITQHLELNTWKAFVDHHLKGNVFHTPEMFAVFNRTLGCKPTLWAAVEKDAEVLALLLPVQITLLNGFFRSWTSRAVAYGNALCVPDVRGASALKLLLQTYNREVRNSLLFTEFRNLFDPQDVNPVLVENGFKFEDHLNFLIDLDRPPAEIWNEVRSNARRNIKKAQRSEVQIVELQDPRELTAAYHVLKEVYKRIHVPLPDISLFQSAYQIMAPKGMFKIILAKLHGTIIGVLCLLLYKGIVHYWYTGTLREYASYRAGDLLVWHSLEFGNQNGFHTFDFGGGGKPDEEYGVRDFKAKFGGVLVNYGRNICVHGPLRLKVSQAGYQLLRRFL